MKFIKLTRFDGVPVTVNTKRIQYMIPYVTITTIVFDGIANSLDVIEDLDRIIHLIEEAR